MCSLTTALCLLVLLNFQPLAAMAPSLGAVASTHPMASVAGEEIIKKGGNAFDAAIAITAALAVVEPNSSGLGGGGFWLLHRASDGKQVMLDGREKAPGFAHLRMYQDDQGNIRPGVSIDGPLAAAIPGIPAGIVYLAEHYGKLPLRVSLKPAIRYARKGFKVTERYRSMAGFKRKTFLRYPESAAIFLKDKAVPELGYRLKQKDLSRALELLAEKGKAGFYAGELAGKMVLDVNTHGGIWSKKDLADYEIIERKPIETMYRGVKIVSAPPPSSGGIVIAQALRMLENFDLQKLRNVPRKHLVVEAMRRAYRDRAVSLGDPDFYDVQVKRLLDKNYLDSLALNIDPTKATPSFELSDTPGLAQAGSQATHFSVIDAEGNRVAATLSINLIFGSGFVPKGTGILLNNEMDDFSNKENILNYYVLVGDQANAIEPGKRPLSSMAPTFLETQDRIAILGTPGGSKIISMVLLATLDFINGNSQASMVSLPRYHHQYLPDELQFEQGGLTTDEQRALIAMGHKLKENERNYGNMQAIVWDKKLNKVQAASDPRGEGIAIVIDH